MPVAVARLRTFQVAHPPVFVFVLDLRRGILAPPAAEFELFHLHLAAVKFLVVVQGGIRAPEVEVLEASELPTFWADLMMQSDMLGDMDCERPDQNGLFPSNIIIN